MDTANSRKGIWLSLAGWIIGAIAMLLVKGGDVGQALTSLPMILVTACVVATMLVAMTQTRGD